MADSPWIGKHHANWRFQALKSIDEEPRMDDLHYTSGISVSATDAPKVREILVRAIEEVKQVVRPSPAEQAHGVILGRIRQLSNTNCSRSILQV
jgi:hypothetical protein